MTDNELLLSISEIMDKKIEPLKKDMQSIKNELKEDIQTVRRDIENNIKPDIHKIKLDIENNIKPDIHKVKLDIENNIKSDIHKIKLDIENNIKPNICILAENYLPSAKRYEMETNKIEALESDIGLMKKVITEHSEKLQKIS